MDNQTILAPAELELIAKQIATFLREQIAAQPMLVDRTRIAELTGVSVPTVDRLTKSGVIPSIKVGSRRLYDPSDVVKQLKSGS